MKRQVQAAYAAVRTEVGLQVRAAYEARLEAPPPQARVRRFLWGLTLPGTVLRAVWRDPEARRAWRRVTNVQLTLVGCLALVLAVHAVARHVVKGGGIRAVLGELWASALVWYSAIVVVEWIIVVLSREHHEALSFRAGLLIGAPGEPPAAAPRVRFDVGWLWTKGLRQLRALWLFVIGVPALALRARHARRRLDPALHALEQRHELRGDLCGALGYAERSRGVLRETESARGVGST